MTQDPTYHDEAHAPMSLTHELIICMAAPLLLLLNVAVCAGLWVWWNGAMCTGSPSQAARYEVEALEGMVEQQMALVASAQAPARLEALTEGPAPVVTTLPRDPWGRAYGYVQGPDGAFEVFSLGPDGVGGTADDIRGGRR